MIRVLIVAITLLTAISETNAQITLTLNEALNIALDENPTIKQSELEIERYDYVRKTTMGAILPQVSIDGTYNRTLENQAMAEGFSLGANKYNTFTAAGNLSLALYAPTVYRTMQMNRSQAEAAVEAARSSRIDLVQQVKSSFYAILLAEESLVVLQENALTAKQTVEESQIKYDNGLVAEYDLLTAQVQYSNLQPLIIQAEAAIDISKDLLKMYLFIPSNIEIDINGELEEFRTEAIAQSDNLGDDISGNSSLRSLELQDKILADQLRISQAGRLPTLGAYGQINYTGNNMGSFSLDGTTESSSSSDYFWQNPASVGLQLSVPLFQGLSNTNRARDIKNQLEQLTLSRKYAEQSVVVELRSAITTILTSREQMFAEQQTVAQARKAYSIAETRYNSGTGTILELNTARLTLTQSELNYSQAIYNLLVAHSEYEKIIGSEN